MARNPPIEVRATVTLPFVPVGSILTVNPNSEYIAECIEAGLLVPLKPPRPEPEPEPASAKKSRAKPKQ